MVRAPEGLALGPPHRLEDGFPGEALPPGDRANALFQSPNACSGFAAGTGFFPVTRTARSSSSV
jgi:hypothetical protein